MLPNIIQTYVLLVERRLFTLLSANSKTTHHNLVSYLKVKMITSGVVCWLLLKLAVGKSYNKSHGYIALDSKLGYNGCGIN